MASLVAVFDAVPACCAFSDALTRRRCHLWQNCTPVCSTARECLPENPPVIGFPVYHALSSAVLGLSGGATTPSGCLRVRPERWFRDMAIRVTTRNRLETCPILSGEAANRRAGLSRLLAGVVCPARVCHRLLGRHCLRMLDVRPGLAHWRERPVPAAAVIPAPMAYLPIVAVEALVAPVARVRSTFRGCTLQDRRPFRAGVLRSKL